MHGALILEDFYLCHGCLSFFNTDMRFFLFLKEKYEEVGMRAVRGIALIVLAMSGNAAAADLRLYYSERAPYYVAQGGKVRGVLADVASAAVRKAGIPFVWESMPPARQFEGLKLGILPGCMVGVYKNPERETYAHFTRAIYRNRPAAALGRRDDVRLASIMSIDSLLADPRLVLLVKKSYSYGAFIDKKIAELQPRRWETTVESRTMFRQIAARRADYMFMETEEAEHAVTTPQGNGLAVYPIPGMPPGNLRYLMCSRAVPLKIVQRIDAALPTKPAGGDGDEGNTSLPLGSDEMNGIQLDGNPQIASGSWQIVVDPGDPIDTQLLVAGTQIDAGERANQFGVDYFSVERDHVGG